MKRGKTYLNSLALIDRQKQYETAEAIELVLQTAKAKFDETIELHCRLGVDPRHADQQVRGIVVLPHGTGKIQKVLVIAKGPKADEAKEAGADIVGAEEIIQKIQGGWFDFDVCVTTPDMMSQVGRLGKLLGPKGLMPSPKAGTVTMDVKKVFWTSKPVKLNTEWTKSHYPLSHRQKSFGKEKLEENLKPLWTK